MIPLLQKLGKKIKAHIDCQCGTLLYMCTLNYVDFQSVPVGVRDALEANIQDLYINKFWGLKYATVAACTVLKVDQVSVAPKLILYTGKYSPPFYFRPFQPRCQRVNLKIGQTPLSQIIPL